MQQTTKKISLVFSLLLSIFSSRKTFAKTEMISLGLFKIKIDSKTYTFSNSIKSIGLKYDSLKNYYVSVKRLINSVKVKNGIDFLHNG
jgi:hypothetical protein